MIEIWVDGDSCPVPVRELLVRTARRRAIPLRFCANWPLPLPSFPDAAAPNAAPDAAPDVVEMHHVTDGTVDDYILARTAPDSLVVTRDIPLAEKLVERGIPVMNDRGRLFDADSVREIRSLRDAAAAIRLQGLESMPTAVTYGKRELKAFADTLDRFLARNR